MSKSSGVKGVSSEGALTRVLLILSLVQTCFILFLSFKVLGLETRIVSASQKTTPTQLAAAPAERVVYTNAEAGPSLDDIRAVIKEEIASLAADGPKGAAPGQPPTQYSAAEAEQQFAIIRKEIDAYILRGDMSEAEMAAIQMKIGKLPPTERRRAMGRIIKAIDAGSLDAQL